MYLSLLSGAFHLTPNAWHYAKSTSYIWFQLTGIYMYLPLHNMYINLRCSFTVLRSMIFKFEKRNTNKLTIHDDPYRPEVGAGTIMPMAHNLWCHVQRRTSQDGRLGVSVTQQIMSKSKIWFGKYRQLVRVADKRECIST